MSRFSREAPSLLVAFATANPDRPLYQRDVLNALCYPKDWVLRLTYRDKWVAMQLKKDLALDRLRKRDILIVFCGHPDPALKTFGKVVPLRFGRVISSAASSLGQEPPSDIVVLRISLQGWPGGTFLKTGSALLTVPRLDEGFYLTMIPRSIQQMESKCDAGALGETVCAAPEMQTSRVFYVLEPAPRAHWWQRRESRPRVVSSRTSDVTILKVSAGKSYRLSFAIPKRSYVPEEEIPIDIKIRGEHLEIAEPVVHQRSSGAEVSYLLVVQRKYAAELATLVARFGRPVNRNGAPAPDRPGERKSAPEAPGNAANLSSLVLLAPDDLLADAGLLRSEHEPGCHRGPLPERAESRILAGCRQIRRRARRGPCGLLGIPASAGQGLATGSVGGAAGLAASGEGTFVRVRVPSRSSLNSAQMRFPDKVPAESRADRRCNGRPTPSACGAQARSEAALSATWPFDKGLTR